MSPFTPAKNSAADRLSSPEYESSPLASTKQHMEKRRAPTPEDRDDDDYAPSPKRRKPTGSSSSRVARNEANNNRGTALPMPASVHAKNGATHTEGILDIQTSTEPKKRVPDIIVIDDTPAELPAVSSSSRPVERSTSSSDSSRPSLGQAANKRKVISESERSASALEPDPERQRRNDLTLEAVNLKVDALSSIISSWMTQHSHMPEDFVEQCYSILRTVNDPKGSVIGNLLKDLESERALKARYRDMVRKIVKYVDPKTGTAFPREPAHQEIEQIWKQFQEYVVSIVGFNNISPEISTPGAGYLTCCAENIAYGRIPGKEIEAYIESLGEYLKSPHAQQALFGALFCHWLFATPERMLDAMHSDGMMAHYKSVFDNADTKAIGLATIQQQDKVAAKLMFEDPDFIDTKYKYRTSDIKERFQSMREKLCQESSIPPSMAPSEFAKEAVDLKQNLLLSPKEYRIHYIRPDTKFDASLMQAVDRQHFPVPDAKAADKKVSLCLYPLFLTLEPEPIKEDTKIEEMLCKNKRFMPNIEEISRARVPGSQVSKAVVLLVEE